MFIKFVDLGNLSHFFSDDPIFDHEDTVRLIFTNIGKSNHPIAQVDYSIEFSGWQVIVIINENHKYQIVANIKYLVPQEQWKHHQVKFLSF